MEPADLSASTVSGACHCGAVIFRLDHAPEDVTECSCSICRRYGVLWAYYRLNQVHFEPRDLMTDHYKWGAETIAFHRCTVCGCVTHWSPINRNEDRMGINARLLEPFVLDRARLRHLDGADTEQYLD